MKFNTIRINLYLDLILALLFVVSLEKNFTGQNDHELLGLVFGGLFLIHIILHWKWIVGVTRTFFKNLLHGSRLNYVLNMALFIDLIVTVVTGVLISRTLGLDLGLSRDLTSPIEALHRIASDLSLIIVGLHVAVHWKWILTHSQRYLLNFNFLRRKPRAIPAPVPALSQPLHTSKEA